MTDLYNGELKRFATNIHGFLYLLMLTSSKLIETKTKMPTAHSQQTNDLYFIQYISLNYPS